jgi:hypothetical protein
MCRLDCEMAIANYLHDHPGAEMTPDLASDLRQLMVSVSQCNGFEQQWEEWQALCKRPVFRYL